MMAAKQGQREVVQELIEKGADVNAKNGAGGTARSVTQDPEIITLLVQGGAQP